MIAASKKGFVAFSTVLIVSFVVLAIAFATTITSISEGRSSLAYRLGEQGLDLVESCVEDAYLTILVDNAGNSYTGSTIVHPEGNCTNTVISKLSNVWTMQTTTQSTTFKRTIQTVFTRVPAAINILSDASDGAVGSLVNGCTTTAENSSQADKNYTGGTISGGGGTCSVSVSKNGTVWTLVIVGTATDSSYAGTRQVILDREPPRITLTTWKEI